MPLLQFVICGPRVQSDGAKGDQGPFFRPVDRGVIHDVALVGDLDSDLKSDKPGCQAMCKLLEQVVGVLALGRRLTWMFDARFRRNAVAAVSGDPSVIDET